MFQRIVANSKIPVQQTITDNINIPGRGNNLNVKVGLWVKDKTRLPTCIFVCLDFRHNDLPRPLDKNFLFVFGYHGELIYLIMQHYNGLSFFNKQHN